MVTAIERKHIYEWFHEECERLGIDPKTLDIEAEADWSLTYHEIIDQLADKWIGLGFTAPWAPTVVEVVKVKPERVRKLEGELKKLREEKKRWAAMKDFERMRLLERVKELEQKINEAKVGKPEAPPAPKPEPKFKVGERAFHPTLKDVVILVERWHEDAREWTYVVRARKKEEIVFEHELIKLPPPPERVPRPPRVPKPPPTLEEIAVSPYTKKPLLPFKGPLKIITYKEVLVEPIEERWKRREAGLPETEVKPVPEELKIPPGFIVYTQLDRMAPDFGRFYMVEDFKLKSMTYDELVRRVQTFYRRIAPPPVPAKLPWVAYAPAMARPFEVPFQDRDAFFAWLGKEGISQWAVSDPEQQKRLYTNWRELIK